MSSLKEVMENVASASTLSPYFMPATQNVTNYLNLSALMRPNDTNLSQIYQNASLLNSLSQQQYLSSYFNYGIPYCYPQAQTEVKRSINDSSNEQHLSKKSKTVPPSTSNGPAPTASSAAASSSSPPSSLPRKKIDRFDGVSEEEVAKKFLPDHIDHNLDILVIGINPGLYAAHKGHHYAGPGNHFWKCLYLSGLTPKQLTAYDDLRMLDFGIGFTNVVARTTRGASDLSKKEIEEGGKVLLSKLQHYKPKIAVFNGKGIYEVFSKEKNFYFGKQPHPIPNTNTAIWVMPSSSARCSQLPRASDKVLFYVALRKLRDNLNGTYPGLTEGEVVFTDVKLRNYSKKTPPKPKSDLVTNSIT